MMEKEWRTSLRMTAMLARGVRMWRGRSAKQMAREKLTEPAAMTPSRAVRRNVVDIGGVAADSW